MFHAVVMAGGGGTRFWPRSRKHRPKQFLALAGGRTLLQQAYDRLEAAVPPERAWIITSEVHRAEAAQQLPNLPPSHVVGEPCGRDTAACIALGAALIAREDADAVMMITPADHVIEPTQEFRRATHVAEQMALEHPNALVTFGIQPTFPAVGYGYIRRGAETAQRQGMAVYRVQEFKEKPDLATAERFLASGEYYWNSGIFVWRAATILNALQERQPKMFEAVQRIAASWNTPDGQRVLAREYEALPKISIDFAIMQDAPEVLVVQAPYRWDDVGSWLALERMHPQDADQNTVLATHCGIDTKNCVIVGDTGRLITTIGVSDLLIIQDGDSLLVANRRDEATVKQLVDKLGKQALEKYL